MLQSCLLCNNHPWLGALLKHFLPIRLIDQREIGPGRENAMRPLLAVMNVFDSLHHRLREGLLARTLQICSVSHCEIACVARVHTALVAEELAGGETSLEHLLNLLQGTILGLWNEEPDKCCGDQARWEPDVAVLRTPVHSGRVNEVWGSEGSEPGANEANTGGKSESV